jgi:hypothetical protein
MTPAPALRPPGIDFSFCGRREGRLWSINIMSVQAADALLAAPACIPANLKAAYDIIAAVAHHCEDNAFDTAHQAMDAIRMLSSHFPAFTQTGVDLQIEALPILSTHVLELVDRDRALECTKASDRLADHLGAFVRRTAT